jgi:hypothetical protein
VVTQLANVYRPVESRLLALPFPFSFARLSLRLVERVTPGALMPSEVTRARARWAAVFIEGAQADIPQLRQLREARPVHQVTFDGSVYWIYPYQLDAHQADILAAHSAEVINAFFHKASAARKKMLLILHPSKEHVYLTDTVRREFRADFDRPLEALKALLDPRLPVLDLTPAFRARAGSTGRLFYRFDGHYTIAGYRLASEVIGGYLRSRADVFGSTTLAP